MWIIGDIHGCLEELELLLEKLPKKEKLLFLGDYIDRGPDSAGTVNRLLKEKERSFFLMGNHEAMLLDFYGLPNSKEGQSWLLLGNGGENTLSSYGLAPDAPFDSFPEAHQEFYKGLKLYYEGADFIAVHAGLRLVQGKDRANLKKQKRHDLLWIRQDWLENESQWKGKKVYYGHTPSRFVLGIERQNEIIQGISSIGLDTGCVYGGCLTALQTENGKMIQIPRQMPVSHYE